MRTRIFVVDAFTEQAFKGNPAAVCLLQKDVSEEWMQSLAAEMKHPETAFVRFTGENHELRWFTPTTEVDLCGHATLAAAHVLWEQDLHSKWQPIRFHTKSGILTAVMRGPDAVLDFPSEPAEVATPPADIVHILGCEPVWFGRNRMDWFAEVPNEFAVTSLVPDLARIEAMGMRGLIVTSRAEETDFVSRFFAPQSGVEEDHVTGSAHCCLGPYWAEKLGKQEVVGYQASPRGGFVRVNCLGDRVELIGNAITVLEGFLRC
ncbi:MAG: PhzF family phenazine biosynthesis protein [Fimbriimonas sp.]